MDKIAKELLTVARELLAAKPPPPGDIIPEMPHVVLKVITEDGKWQTVGRMPAESQAVYKFVKKAGYDGIWVFDGSRKNYFTLNELKKMARRRSILSSTSGSVSKRFIKTRDNNGLTDEGEEIMVDAKRLKHWFEKFSIALEDFNVRGNELLLSVEGTTLDGDISPQAWQRVEKELESLDFVETVRVNTYKYQIEIDFNKEVGY